MPTYNNEERRDRSQYEKEGMSPKTRKLHSVKDRDQFSGKLCEFSNKKGGLLLNSIKRDDHALMGTKRIKKSSKDIVRSRSSGLYEKPCNKKGNRQVKKAQNPA